MFELVEGVDLGLEKRSNYFRKNMKQGEAYSQEGAHLIGRYCLFYKDYNQMEKT